MKTYIFPALKLTALLIFLCAIIYPLLITGIAKMTTEGGNGITVYDHGIFIGYKDIGQKFTDDKYFWSRPSAVEYNGAGSGGSNKGPTNPEYLATVQARIDTFIVHNPAVKKEEIPIDLVTASASGLDPDISVKAAKVQVPRIAKIRNKNEKELYELIDNVKEGSLFGFLGPEKVNVVKLNVGLNNIK